jgi:hypothetical protein
MRRDQTGPRGAVDHAPAGAGVFRIDFRKDVQDAGSQAIYNATTLNTAPSKSVIKKVPSENQYSFIQIR